MSDVIRNVTFTTPDKPEFNLTVPLIASNLEWLVGHAERVARMMLEAEQVEIMCYEIEDYKKGEVRRKAGE